MSPWFYEQRDFVSWAVAVSVAALTMGMFSPEPQRSNKPGPVEILAMFDSPTAPPESPALKPQPVRVTQPRSLPKNFAPDNVPTTVAPSPLPDPVSSTVSSTVPAVSQAPTQMPGTVSALHPQPSVEAKPQQKPSAEASYESRLLAYLERIKRYPSQREARLTKPQGVVKLWLLISRGGQLLEVGLVTSSGHNLLDGEALRTLRSGTYPAFPEDFQPGQAQHRFIVSMKYDIEG